MSKTCETCQHWTEARLCCRFPPQAVLWPETKTTYAAVAFRFPEMAAEEHCGEWKQKEAKECSENS